MSVTPHGNEVVNNPVIYPVWFWNADGTAGATFTLALALLHYLGNLIASGYFGGLEQYGAQAPAMPFSDATSAQQYLSSHVIQWLWPASQPYDKDDIETYLKSMVTAGMLPDPAQTDTPGPVFLLFMPSGMEVSHDGESSIYPTDGHSPFGGFHDATTSESVSGEENVFYCVVAWPSYGVGGPNSQTLMPLPTGNTDPNWQQVLDALTSTASHELVEAFTERDGDGWHADDSSGSEIADLCETNRGARLISPTGVGWAIERYWRNDLGSCWPTGNLGQAPPPPPPPPPATLVGPVAAATTTDGRIYAFAKTTDGHLRLKYWDGASWRWNDQGLAHGRKSVGLGGLAAVVINGTRPYAFLQCDDGHLWVNYWDGTQWDWSDQGTPTGQTFGGAIAAIAVEGSQPFAFVQGSDGDLWVNYWTGSHWSWRNQGTPPGHSLSASISAVTVKGRPYVFLWGSDGHLWINYWTGSKWLWDDRGAPSGTATVNGPIAAVAVNGSRPYVFARASDGRLWVNYWDGSHWQWQFHGAPEGKTLSASDIAVVDVNASSPYVFVKAGDGELYRHWWDGSQWHWDYQGAPAGTALGVGFAAVAVAGKLPYVFVQTGDSHLWVSYLDAGNWYWSDQGAPPS